MTTVRATCSVASGVMLFLLSTELAAEEEPDIRVEDSEQPTDVVCPCADVYAEAIKTYDELPGPSVCLSGHSQGEQEWEGLSAEKKELPGKWRRGYLTMQALEYCTFGIRCARCVAYVHVEKKISFFLHELVGEHHSGLSDEELTACRTVARNLLQHCKAQ